MFIFRCLVPIYLEVRLDKLLKFCHHHLALHKKFFFVCPATDLTCGLKGAITSDSAFLFIVYSTAEYWNLICSGSARTWFLYSVLNEALRVVTECLSPSPTDHLTVFSNNQPSEL